MSQHISTAGPDAKNDGFDRFFANGVQAVLGKMFPPPEDMLREAVALCRELTDHLAAYVHAAANFDEDAYIAVEKAEQFLARPAVKR